MFAYSSWFFSEPLTTALMMAVAYFVFACHQGEAVPVGSAVIGGYYSGLRYLFVQRMYWWPRFFLPHCCCEMAAEAYGLHSHWRLFRQSDLGYCCCITFTCTEMRSNLDIPQWPKGEAS